MVRHKKDLGAKDFLEVLFIILFVVVTFGFFMAQDPLRLCFLGSDLLLYFLYFRIFKSLSSRDAFLVTLLPTVFFESFYFSDKFPLLKSVEGYKLFGLCSLVAVGFWTWIVVKKGNPFFGSVPSWQRKFVAIIFFIAGCGFSAWFLEANVQWVNAVWDQGQPRDEQVRILDLSESSSGGGYATPPTYWLTYQGVTDTNDSEEIEVREDFYNSHKKGDVVTLQMKPGFLKLEWLVGYR